jgi:mRNA interferase RelE/StbE
VSFHVEVRRSAEKELGRLAAQAGQRIAAALLGLAQEPLPPSVKKLKGSHAYRIRIGDYRVLYTVDMEKRKFLFSRLATGKKFIAENMAGHSLFANAISKSQKGIARFKKDAI